MFLETLRFAIETATGSFLGVLRSLRSLSKLPLAVSSYRDADYSWERILPHTAELFVVCVMPSALAPTQQSCVMYIHTHIHCASIPTQQSCEGLIEWRAVGTLTGQICMDMRVCHSC